MQGSGFLCFYGSGSFTRAGSRDLVMCMVLPTNQPVACGVNRLDWQTSSPPTTSNQRSIVFRLVFAVFVFGAPGAPHSAPLRRLVKCMFFVW